MNTVQLECFLSVAEHLNFSRASEELKITQPAVSHQIQSLEAELEVKLFRRTSKSVTLTPEVLLFLQDDGIILKTARAAKERLGNPGRRLISLDAGCGSQMEMEIFSSVTGRLIQEFPVLRPQLHLAPPESLTGMVENRHLHAALGFYEKGGKINLVFKKMASCPVACICAPGSPLAEREALNFSDLQGSVVICHTHLLPPELAGLHSRIASLVSYRERYFGDRIETILPLVKAGLGYTLYPDLPGLRLPDLRYIPVKDLAEMDYGLYYRPDSGHPVLRRLAALTGEFLKTAGFPGDKNARQM